MSNKNTFYRLAWEDPTQFPNIAPWIIKAKDNQHFTCRICKSRSFKLSNTGIEQLTKKPRN